MDFIELNFFQSYIYSKSQKGLILRKLTSIATTLAMITSTLVIPTTSFAKSKKYYQYKLKAAPAQMWYFGKVGDHTYVCIKKKKKKHGKYKTIKNYGCFARAGGTSGGSTRGKWYVRASGYTKARKNSAIITNKKRVNGHYNWACTMVYGIEGVCHQYTKRILYALLKGDLLYNRSVFGYREYERQWWSRKSRGRYGPYGIDWPMCRKFAYGY